MGRKTKATAEAKTGAALVEEVLPPPRSFPPEWAAAWGADPYGLYADLALGETVQKLRWIPPGRFLMGSPKDEEERENNEVQHEVILTQGFWMGDTACNQALWTTVMDQNPSRFKGEDRPVERVDWYDCQAFLERLNREWTRSKGSIFPLDTAQEKDETLEQDPAGFQQGWVFRLPTEAEWEYACRAGTRTPFWFGENITPEQVNYDGNFPYHGGRKGKYREETVGVKDLPCNDWGLYQMHGNVWEWCLDWYGAYPKGLVLNPAGPQQGDRRILRGGSWDFSAGLCRSADRYLVVPANRGENCGFRCVFGVIPRTP